MKLWIASGMVLAALVAGCGGSSSDESPAPSASPAATGSTGEIKVLASTASDRKIGDDLANYLNRNCPAGVRQSDNPTLQQLYTATADFCGGVTEIAVQDKRITVRTDLEPGSDSETLGNVFCVYVAGSDVADFTSGHTLLDASGSKIKTCPARSLP